MFIEPTRIIADRAKRFSKSTPTIPPITVQLSLLITVGKDLPPSIPKKWCTFLYLAHNYKKLLQVLSFCHNYYLELE
ncbi:MAG: hypothetical protein R2800_11030 [Flavipsychrobacter sp.]